MIKNSLGNIKKIIPTKSRLLIKLPYTFFIVCTVYHKNYLYWTISLNIFTCEILGQARQVCLYFNLPEEFTMRSHLIHNQGILKKNKL